MYKKWKRIGAAVIDNSIIILFSQLLKTILMFFFGNILAIRLGGQPIDLALDFIRVMFFLLITVVLAIEYNMLCFNRYGRTLGQILLNVYVIDEKSTNKRTIPVTKEKLLIRERYKWFLLIGTFYIYGFFCIIQILFNQEVYHNKVAKTKTEAF